MPSRRRNGTHRAERLFEHQIAGAALAPSALGAASRAYFGDRSKAPLPAERIADVALVDQSDTAHIIRPWPRGPLDFVDETRLLTVLARTDKLKPAGPCWGWPDPYRDPWPVEAPHPRSWLVRWAEGKASYVARRGCKCWALSSTIFVEVEGREWDAD